MILTGLMPDGSRDQDATFEHVVIEPGGSEPAVDAATGETPVITLRPLSNERYRESVKRHSKRVPNRTGRLEEQTDWLGLTQDLAAAAIVGWRGLYVYVAGEDGQDRREALACTEAAKRNLPVWLLTQVVEAAQRAVGADERAASFREP